MENVVPYLFVYIGAMVTYEFLILFSKSTAFSSVMTTLIFIIIIESIRLLIFFPSHFYAYLFFEGSFIGMPSPKYLSRWGVRLAAIIGNHIQSLCHIS